VLLRVLPPAATLWPATACLLALLALRFPLLALPVALFVFLSFLASPREPVRTLRVRRIAHAAAGVVAAVAFGIFMQREAVPGIVEGGSRAAGGRAISRLREILFAEDAARKHPGWDPDGDGVGSALLVGELSGELGVRGQARLDPPLLEGYPKSEPVSAGRALEIGEFWFMVCLPTTTAFSSEPDATFDDERAERRFVAYAWPSGRAPGLAQAYFIDEHDNILSAPSSAATRFGMNHAPTCDDALAPRTRGAWSVWRGKKPRDKLPGG